MTSGGLLGVWGKWMKHAKYIYNIQDFNPEQVLAVGYTKSKLITDAMMWFDKFSCKRSDLVITVGRDLVETVENRFKDKKVPKTVMINNWIDENEIYPLDESNEKVLYTFAFLTSLDYTENCYSCRYATLDRVSDITLGDSWGSELSREEQKKGISLILCQTEKGVELVKSAGFELEEVDLDKAVTANHQLRHPSEMPDKRNTFFENIDRGFHYAISKCYPKMYYKRRLKTFLQKTKIIGGGANRNK